MNQAEARFPKVLITRPQAEAERLGSRLEAMGIRHIIQPAQEFGPRQLSAEELDELRRLRSPLLIFTSPRAVDFGLARLSSEVLSTARLAAIGPATAKALVAAGKRVDIQPDAGYTSEALLESPALADASAGREALILGAPGGREMLVNHLTERGWNARHLWVYERQPAAIRPQALEAITEARSLLTVFTSGDAMKSLSQRLPPAVWFAVCRGEWLVISERLRRLARAFGPSVVHLSSGPQNADLATAIRSLRVGR